MYFYCYVYIFLMYVYVSYSCQLALCVTLTEVFPFFFLSSKATARVKPAKTGTVRTLKNLFYVLFVLCRSLYFLCVNVHCTTATGWLPNCSEQIYHIIYHIAPR